MLPFDKQHLKVHWANNYTGQIRANSLAIYPWAGFRNFDNFSNRSLRKERDLVLVSESACVCYSFASGYNSGNIWFRNAKVIEVLQACCSLVSVFK